MRNLVTLITFLCLGTTFGISQNPIEITGTVADDQGDGVAGVELFISAFFADSTFHFSTVITDDQGVYSDSFTPSANDQQGIVMVDMIDCDGTFQQSIATWAPNITTLQLDFLYCAGGMFDSCGVVIIQDISPNGGFGLYALPFTNHPATYVWSTGETTEFIVPAAPGTYCVTIADNTGCTATDCYEFLGDTAFCDVMIIPGITGTGSGLTAVGFGFPPFAYSWSTGEHTESIMPSEPGEYCVTLTDATGCEASACYLLDSTFCEVWITCDPPGSLTAMAFGHEPITYLWSDGSTTQTITPAEPGTYCVTIADALGCTSTSCAVHQPIDFCDTQLFLGSDSMGNPAHHLFAFSVGIPPFVYQWSTGDSTDHILVDSLIPGICVTVTDATGCVDTACTDDILNQCWSWIDVAYTANGIATLTVHSDVTGSGNASSYQWSTGDLTASITVQTEGEYCVTVANANGCTSIACVYVDFDFGIDSCFAIVIGAGPGDPNGAGYTLEALAFGLPPFSYTWSNGQTGPVILVDTLSPDLCVTVTDATGCVAEACYIDYGYPGCDVWIDPQLTDTSGVWTLTAHTPQDANTLSYEWNTGETTPSIQVDQTGEYCVTIFGVTPLDSCAATACIFINVNDSTGTGGLVQGFIFGDGFQSFSGQVELYALNINAAGVLDIWTLQDSTPIVDDNFYQFDDLAPGLYSVRAVLDPNSPASDVFFPTYHYSAVEWTEADFIFVPSMLAITNDIYLIPQTDTNGTGIISGTLIDDDGLLPPPVEGLRAGGIEGVQINLLSDQQSVKRFTHTNAAGEYTFHGLDWGTYQLRFEVAGITSPEVWVTIGPGQTEAGGIVLSTTDLTSGTTELLPQEAISIYPQPAGDWLTLELDASFAGDYHLRLMSITGQTLLHRDDIFDGSDSATLDVSGLTSGVYLVQVISNRGQVTRKWIKQ